MIRVGINGYGTIGKRVADAVRDQPDMEVVGVAKTRPNFEAEQAVERGYDLYAAIEDRAHQFAESGLETAGLVDELVAQSDVVVDATPSGVGAENRALYEEYDTPALYQGGEDAEVADVSFNARANFDAARDADHVRVVSCNTTGLSRLITPLKEQFGVEKVRATLVRRGGDPTQSDRGPINDIVPDPITVPSHHGPDVNTVIPDVDIDTLGLKVPATLMHMHSVNVTLAEDVDAEAVRDALRGEPRLWLIDDSLGIETTADAKEYAMDRGRPRGDVWENAVWTESVNTEGRDLYLFEAIHQESDVVPENVDAIRAVTDADTTAEESVRTTNQAMGVDLGGE
ncbi:type II glyceraldehyde-3-phosphate dehydrogenase [Halocalculus aciditolerans]|uniref:Glyceraldehyde-3-phosphate dehydrogenase n=1 Tax=Halocalculus aciditolerans TaxID=1383812 RepID=A0A830FA48_9EURY|nr:type II glyceraldehyde-3-phosphate dehydrogenase [Halocalculus aciditolerans]GGL69429.1 glyceraldehyde-3-phosphate dehydrogenase [Halocalculus aciditolerans]